MLQMPIDAISMPERLSAADAPAAMVYRGLMIILSVYLVLAMAATEITAVPEQMRDLLEWVDLAVCAIFFVDFIIQFVKAENRLRYFFTWGWLDLISSIPSVGFLRYGRLARVLRIIRVLRAFKAGRIVVTYLLRRRRYTAIVSLGVISTSLIVFSSLAILAFEPGMGGHIDNAAEALWWAVCTMATVGYGDVVPVTFEGRIIATVLMFAGVGLFAAMSGIVASWLVESDDSSQRRQLDQLAASIQQLQTSVDLLLGERDSTS
jgi:voltage-gated potassium channel